MLRVITPLFLVIPLAIILIVFSIFGSKASAATWTENWDSYESVLTRWDGIGDAGSGFNPRCFTIPTGGLLDMKCQSAALISKQKFDKQSTTSVQSEVMCEPNVGNRCLAGLILLGSDDPTCDYKGLYAGQSNIIIIDDCTSYTVRSSTIGRWYNFKIVYNASRKSTDYYVDGSKVKTVRKRLDFNPSAEVLCASVDPGTPNDGSSAHCQFKPVTVNGVLVGTEPFPTPTPTPIPTPLPSTSPTPTPTPSPSPSPSVSPSPTPTPTPSSTPNYCVIFPRLCR